MRKHALPNILLNQLQRAYNAVHVRALVAMGGINAAAYNAMRGIYAAAERNVHVRTVGGIDIHGVVHARGLCGVYKAGGQRVVAGAGGILGADA